MQLKNNTKIKYIKPYKRGVYYKNGEGDLDKRVIKKKDRCVDYDNIWNMTFEEVMKYWDFKEIENLEELM